MDGEENCKHMRYETHSKTQIVKLADLGQWQMILKLSIKCTTCKKSFTFKASPGFSTAEPTVSADSAELRIPIDFPESEDDDERKSSQDVVPPEGYFH